MPPRRETRTDRYSDLGGLAALAHSKVGIVGVGAIGKRIAEILATMTPLKLLSLYDPDTVSVANLGTQGYEPADVGFNKADTVKANLALLNPQVGDHTVAHPCQYLSAGKRGVLHDVLILTPDSMEARRTAIAVRPPKSIVIDARATALTGLIISDRPPFTNWEGSLYTDEEAESEDMGTCHLRMTAYNCYVIAGMAVAELMQMLRDPNYPGSSLRCDSFAVWMRRERFTAPAPVLATSAL